MKKLFNLTVFTVIILFLFSARAVSQQPVYNDPVVVYSFFINSVPDGFSFPMVGFVNRARGDFYSVQAGFVNSVKHHSYGAQVGFVNAAGGTVNGIQVGYINLADEGVDGAQVGFVNVDRGYVNGGQIGFVNNGNDDLNGIQIGFVNRTGGYADGLQSGFVNVAERDVDGAQIGFVNSGRKLNGFQFGFINVADTVESGFPLGFISVVRRGGYKSLGFYWDDMNPYNFSFRIGIKSIYSLIVASYNPLVPNRINFSAGFGSIFPLDTKVYFNPEILTLNVYRESSPVYQQITSFTPNIGFNLTDRLHLNAGPNISWSYSPTSVHTIQPGFRLFNHNFNSKNALNVGFRFGLHYNLTK